MSLKRMQEPGIIPSSHAVVSIAISLRPLSFAIQCQYVHGFNQLVRHYGPLLPVLLISLPLPLLANVTRRGVANSNLNGDACDDPA